VGSEMCIRDSNIPNFAGQGGAGAVSTISGNPVVYAGGGGGGTYQGTANIGGSANAGRGGDDPGNLGAIPASVALANTGSGGGGGGNAITAAAGSSGIVIIRYPSYLAVASSTTGSPSMYITGNWRVYAWVSSGTITF
jgi:hypothetical protein